MLSVDELVEQIRQLSSARRRQLLRRLRINGLVDFDEALTDQDPLVVGTALGLPYSDQSAAPATVEARSVETRESTEPLSHSSPVQPYSDYKEVEGHELGNEAQRLPSEPALFNEQADSEVLDPVEPIDLAESEATPTLPEAVQIDLTQGNHLAPSSGKVVVGAPASTEEQPLDTDDPHAMAPVPGQGPKGVINLVFDGGSKGNPGYGYGSYALEWPGLEPQIVRLQHGNNITNNEAEYDTLLKALQAILKRLNAMGAEPSTAEISIRGDSLLVINQVIGEWKCKHDRLKRRRDKIRAMLDQFEYWELRHHDRDNSVRILGH